MGCADSTEDDSEVSQISSPITSPCTPESGFESCYEVDLTQAEYWQDTLPNPDWRTVTASSDPDLDYEIVIDVRELNGGVIPTKPGQGEYADHAEFVDTYSDLLGVDVENDSFVLSVIGSSVKQEEDGSPTLQSTGVFVFDALTSENGEIIIDQQNYTHDFINPDRFHDFEQVINTGSQQIPLGGVNLYWLPTQVDETLLEDGPFRADLRLFTRDAHYPGSMLVPAEVTVDIVNIRKQFIHDWYRTCYVEWLPTSGGNLDFAGNVRFHCNRARQLVGMIEVTDPYYHLADPDWAFTVPSLSVTYSSPLDAHQSFSREACAYGLAFFTQTEFDGDEVYTPDVNPRDCIVIHN